MIMERKNSSKQNKIGQITIKIIHLKELEILNIYVLLLNKDNKHQIAVQERIKTRNKTYFMLQKNFQKQKIIQKTKIKIKEYNNRQNFNIRIRNLDTNKDR